ncbi:LysR substrate-binding domain-containing protein [Sorangium sp. So ce260]|uniref:LysR substrate-binding domain-containing protein n=1 Tax=Sorangium sp. So ce260 TaxID=3133291 RepID=UPI003F6384DF
MVRSNVVDLRHLRYFLAVAEERHFGRAAQRLHIVQPALSMQIRALENEIGGALFVRTSRRVELTEAGALLVVEAQRAVAQAERAKAIVQQSLRGDIGKVRIGYAGNAILTGKMTDHLRAFRKAHPAAEIELREMPPSRQAEAVLTGEVDVGYCPTFALKGDPRLSVQPIGTWPLVVAMAEEHTLAAHRRVTPKMLAGEPLIMFPSEEAGDDVLKRLILLIGREPRRVHRADTTLSMLSLAGAGLGVALAPKPLIQVKVPRIVYRPFVAPKNVFAELLLIGRADETAGAVRAFVKLASGSPDRATSRS